MSDLSDEQASVFREACTLLEEDLLDAAGQKLLRLAETFGFIPSRLFLSKLCELVDKQEREDEFCAKIEEFKQRFPKAHNPYMLAYQFYLKRGDIMSALREIGACPEQFITHTPTKAAILYAEAKLKIHGFHLSIERDFVDPSLSRNSPLVPADDIAICMMVRDEADVISANLIHHYNLGCRKFVVMDNLSVDGTSSVVSRFARDHTDCTVVLIQDSIEGFYQAKKTQSICNFAIDYFGCAGDELKLLLPLDADEFVDLPSGFGFRWLVDKLVGSDASIVVFHLCNAASKSLAHYDDRQELYSIIDTMEACSGQIVTKNAFDPHFISGVTMGNHILTHRDISRDKLFMACDIGARLVHFKYRSPKHVASKIQNGGKAINATTLGQHYGAHWRTAYNAMEQRGLVVAEEMFEAYCKTTVRYSGRLNTPSPKI